VFRRFFRNNLGIDPFVVLLWHILGLIFPGGSTWSQKRAFETFLKFKGDLENIIRAESTGPYPAKQANIPTNPQQHSRVPAEIVWPLWVIRPLPRAISDTKYVSDTVLLGKKVR
jgi:hypothetical protein